MHIARFHAFVPSPGFLFYATPAVVERGVHHVEECIRNYPAPVDTENCDLVTMALQMQAQWLYTIKPAGSA